MKSDQLIPNEVYSTPDLDYPSSEQQYNETAVEASDIRIDMMDMSRRPVNTTCTSCNQEIITRVKKKPTTRTHIVAALFFCIGGLLCVWIPYCIPSCNNADHFCPNCDEYIGSYVKTK